MQQPIKGMSKLEARVAEYRPIESLVPARWQEGGMEANGVRLHYYRSGQAKPPVLLLHGFNEYGLTWLRVAQTLDPEYDFIILDARGHGLSDGFANGYSSALHVADTREFIRGLGLERPRVIGFSMGGGTALRLGAEYPDLLRSVVVEGWGVEGVHPAGYPKKSEAYRAWFRGWLAWLESLRTLEHKERLLAALPMLAGAGAGLWPEVEYVPMVEGYRLFNPDLARMSINVWAEQNEPQEETLKRVEIPTLIMQHSFAWPTPGAPIEVREAPSEMANVRILCFENTGNLIRREAFEAYMERVRRFLEEN